MSELAQNWGTADVCAWLRTLKLDDVCPAFEQHDVDGNFLQLLDDDTLMEMGIDSKLKRVKILSKKQGLFADLIPEEAPLGNESTVEPDRSRASSMSRQRQRRSGSFQKRDCSAADGNTSSHRGTVGGTHARNATAVEGKAPAGPGRSSSTPRGGMRSMASMRKQREYRKGFEGLGNSGVAVLPGTRTNAPERTVEEDSEAMYMQVRGTTSKLPDRPSASWQNGGNGNHKHHEGDDDDDEPSVDDAYEDVLIARGNGKEEDGMRLDVSPDVASSSMAEATSTSVDMYMATRQRLLSMFPGASPQDVEDALRHSKAQWEDAVDHLLALGWTRNDDDADADADAPTRRVKDENPHRFASDQDADWLHGQLSRDEAEELLDLYGGQNGLFLVRDSSSIEGAYVLSLTYDGKKLHHIVYADPPARYEIFDFVCPSLTDIVGLLSDYQKQDGWYTPLTQHVPRSASTPQPAATDDGAYATIKDAQQHMPRLSHGATQTPPQQHHQQQDSSASPLPSSSTARNQAMAAGIKRSDSMHVPPHQPLGKKTQSFDNPYFCAHERDSDIPPPPPAQLSPAVQFHPQDFDLDITKPTKPYGGDKSYKVTVTNDDNPLQLTQQGFPRDIVMITLASGLQLRASEKGVVHADISYADIQSMDYADRTLRLVVSNGAHCGTFYFESKKARTIYRTLLDNKEHLIQEEDKRLAKLLQSEEFVQHLSHDPEYNRLAHATPTSKKKMLSRFAKSFRSRMARSIWRRSQHPSGQQSTESNPYRGGSVFSSPATTNTATTSSLSPTSLQQDHGTGTAAATRDRSPLSRRATATDGLDPGMLGGEEGDMGRSQADLDKATSPLPPLPPEARGQERSNDYETDTGDADDSGATSGPATQPPVYSVVHTRDSGRVGREFPPAFEDPNFHGMRDLPSVPLSADSGDVDLDVSNVDGGMLGPYDHEVDPGQALQDDMWSQRDVDSITADSDLELGTRRSSEAPTIPTIPTIPEEQGPRNVLEEEMEGFSDTSFDSAAPSPRQP